ncbi:E3 ubiquitin-protein ligase UPL2 [Acorus calamus]|uniref:HECT-type E3 ubiquitin transferase n=1 Tax=Acorus calamus TaxID=4465 RepID=A0AAV9ETB2_ACOCL|nr:E3 ubiquitin-protein ligase UPL2 [Acorus calamus]
MGPPDPLSVSSRKLLYSRISILAFLVLVQSNDAHDELVSFFANEPEYTNELIRLVRSEDAISGDIRTLAMLALGAQLAAYSSSHERAKFLSGSNIIPAGGNRLTLLNVLQKAVLSHSNPSDPSSVMFVDALLQFYLLHVISSSSSGSAIRGSGMVPTLLPFLQDVNPAHMHLVCSAVKILQKLMDYSSQAVNSFKECGGVELLAQRLQTEIQRVIDAPDDKSSMVIGDTLKFDDDCPYSQRRLIKALLKALGSATYTPTNPIRSQNSLDNPIPSSLALIFRNVLKFGGDIYFSAVTVMNEIIHKDPTCFPALHEAGLPDAFLSSVTSGILPSSKALTCIPSGLGAICLNVKGLEAVRECDALRFLYHTFTARKYLVAMNEAVVPLANAVEELLRHVTSLKSTGVEIIIEIINKLISLGHDVDVCLGKSDASSFMETDSEDKEVEGQDNQASASDSIADSISNERFVQLCIFHLMVLLHRTMENTETCKLFVEKKGIEALMRLLLRPSISQSSEGMSIALYSTVVFKGFTQNHAAPLAHAFCSALGDYLKKALREFSSISGSFLLIPTSTPDSGIFSSLSIIEFLLFLAASKDTRWMAALLTEFGNQSKDVLEDIGRIHREVLWQIALIEDSRPEEDDPPIGESLRVDSSLNETEEHRNLLVQPMMSGGSVTAPCNPETFVKVLQSKVLKAVLPIWSHPLFTECNFEFIAALVSIMRHIYSGVEDTKASVSSAAGNIGPPLDEAAVSAVMEMGFSRSRAEEAFRKVGTNIVEMALDWLCTHPEEPEEEDDLARAVAMSLGDAPKEDEVPSGGDLDQEKETVEPPPVDELLSACNRLLQVKDSLAFPVQGLLAMICAQNDGRYRYKVVTFIIDQLKVCTTVSDSRNDCMLSALFHVLALVLHEDAAAREVASTSGLIRIALDLLSQWNPDLHGGEKSSIPKWVTASFLAIDQMLLVDQKLSLDVKSLEALKGEDERSQTSIMINDLQSPVKSKSWGLPALLSLPTSSLFSGFDSVAATIVRHILEDPYTLQQAMEAEIRHSFVAVTNRHSNGRLSPRNFLQSLGSVISRDPAVFMQAAQSVCQIELVGERPYVVLLKDREKKSKEKEKEKTSEKDKQPSPGGKTSSIDTVSPVPGNVHSKPPESNIKNVKVHRKSPPSFISVIELLLDYVITFVPPLKDNDEIEGTLNAPPLVDMDIDGTVARGKGKAIVGVSEEAELLIRRLLLFLPRQYFIKVIDGYTHDICFLCACPSSEGCGSSYKKDKKADSDWRQRLANRASQILVASSVRSSEGRKRIFVEINNVFNDFVGTSSGVKTPDFVINAFIDLLNDILGARSPSGSYILAEVSTTCMDVGMVQTLTRTLRVLDLDHPDSPRTATAIVKALDSITKEYVHSADPNTVKADSSMKPATDQNQPHNGVNGLQSSETTSQPDHHGTVDDRMEPFNSTQASGSSDSITDDMEHDRDMDGGFAAEAEDDFMHEASEEAVPLENGIATIDNSGDLAFLDRNMQSVSSQLDTIFRSLRSGRHGHRFNMWVDEGQTRTGSGAPAIPPGIEELLVSRLRRPTSEQSSEENATGQQPEDKVEPNQMQESDAVAREEPPIGENTSNVGTVNTSLRSTEVGVTGNLDVGPMDNDFLQGGDASNAREPAIEMQYERGSDATLRDVEAVSQESGGSGATLGESLRSLEVEIGSADGHDDGGERQGPTDRISLSDLQPPRARRSSGNPGAVSGREASLRSVSEVPPDTNQVPDALPEELRDEVLSSQQRQATQTPNEQTQPEGDIDPEFLAALPPDIREEVLAQQRAAQRGNHSQELEGQPVEMDTVSIIATFPSDLREEVLLTSSDAILANLTPALVAEAQMLRERRGEGIGSSLDRGRRSVGGKLVEADGAPLVDMEDLKALVRLLRVVQPIYKGPLQRVLLNLCVHGESRTTLVKILMDTLMRDLRGPMKSLNGSGEPSFRLYACQSHIIYSRPQFCNGVPPLLSRRILETLTYLARNHPYVAKFLLHMVLPQPATPNSLNAEQDRGKAVMIMEEDQSERLLQQKGDTSIVSLLSLLNQSLYLRSVAHLEQLLNLLEVIIDSTDDNSALPNKSGVSPPEPQAGSESAMVDVQVNAAVASAGDNKLIMTDDQTKSSASAVNDECNTRDVLLGLPQSELRLLCSLLAREGLSDNAYGLVAEIMKKLVAIIPTHCRLFITELANSVQQLIISAMNELHGYEEIETLLNTSSSDGTTILRVLQALSSLISTLHEKEKDCQLLPEKDLNDALSLVWNIDAALEPLWLELSACISKIESFSESSDRSVYLGTNCPQTPVQCLHFLQKSPGAHSKVDEKHLAFVKFSERHKKLLNAFIRQNSGLLEKSFSLMLKVPRIIDFDNKRNYFRSKIKHQHDHHHSPLRISVRRAYVLEDSYNQLRMRSTQDLKGRLTVNFQGEEGIDAGGLTREWYQLLSRVGKALFDGQLLDVHFTRSFYKHILGVKVTYHDIEAIDPDYFKNLKWMLENDVSEIPDLTFSIDADEEKLILYERTEVTDYELIPGGRNIRVTEENKREYVDLNAEHRLTTAIRPQINAFLEGFNELIPRELVSIFNDKELELLISGLPDIDLDDLRENTEYSGYSPASPVIQWFWEVVQGFSEEDKARLLQFVTGTSKVPLEGFSALQGISGSQKFQIHKAYGSPDHLPSAHTCFNQLDLPEYPSKEQLEERLLLAIHEANEGFGFG